MDMDSQRQREAVFQPLIADLRATARNLCTAAVVAQQVATALGNLLNLSRWNGIGGWLLHVGLPLLLAVGGGRLDRPRPVAACAAALAASGRARPRAGPASPAPRGVLSPLRSPVGPQRAGPRRRPDAAGVRPCWRPTASPATAAAQDLAAAAGRIVDAFYRVRFGGLPLDNPQREAVEHGLAELEHVAAPPPRTAALGPAHEDRFGRLSRVGQEHALRVADGREARRGAVAHGAKRHGRHSRAPRRAAVQDL